MSMITDAIGRHFEDFLDDNFVTLDNRANSRSLAPDFFDSTYDLGLEAKVGYRTWGPSLRGSQLERFEDCDFPVFYALGYHNFAKPGQNLGGYSTFSGMRKRLDRDMGIVDICFLSHDVAKKIYTPEKKIVSSTSSESCLVKPCILNAIFEDRDIIRGGEVTNLLDFYDLDVDEYDFYDEGSLDMANIRAIIHPEKDGALRDFLLNYGLIE